VNAAELAARIARGDRVVVLDVRRHDERLLACIAGSLHIPFDDLEDAIDDDEVLDPSAEYVVICHLGIRSLSAAEMLLRAGLKAWSLRGGIDAWSRLVDPEVPRY